MALQVRWLVPIALSTLGCALDDRTPGIVSSVDGSTSSGGNAPSSAGAGSASVPSCSGAACLALAGAREVTLSLLVRGDGVGGIRVLRDDGSEQPCRDECSIRVASGTQLRLAATPGLNTVLRWSVAGCGSEPTCRLRVDSDLVVEATLELAYNVAFVTSQRYTVAALPRPGNAANQECARVAAAAGLHGSHFVAWLASPGATADAADDVTPAGSFQHRGGWVRPDGLPVARSLASLTRGELLHPIRLDENGAVQTATSCWTAVSTAGTLAPESAPGAKSCRDWTSSDPADQGGIAVSNTTYLGEGFTAACSASNTFLCFGDDSDAELPAAALTGRLAFLSRAFFDPSTGRAAADAICQDEACAASLTGSNDCTSNPGSARIFKAYLHTSSQAAWERFDLSGPNWQRPDGITWLPNAANLAADAKDRLTGLTVRADGSYVLSGLAWVGNQTGANCRDWSSGNYEDRSATTGAEIVDPRGLGAANSSQCSYINASVLCLEE
jgi:hypothetical protein